MSERVSEDNEAEAILHRKRRERNSARTSVDVRAFTTNLVRMRQNVRDSWIELRLKDSSYRGLIKRQRKQGSERKRDELVRPTL